MNPHRSVFSQHPLAQLAVAFATGVCATHYTPARFSFMLSAGAACSASALALLWRSRLRAAGVACSASALGLLWRSRLRAAGVALLLAMFFVGATLADLERRADDASDVKRILTRST